jgi:choline dehydrogenase-like flavoprotein
MIREESAWSLDGEIRADVAIVGAGAAGISLALELEGHGFSVLLLEGGESEYSMQSQSLYSGDSTEVPLPYGLEGSRLRFLGGSTNCWGGACGELDDEDFLKRAWIKFSGWPIKKHNLAEFYKRAAKFLKLKEPVSHSSEVSKGFKEINGMDFRFLSHTSVLRFRSEFYSHIESSENIQLLLGANCLDISASIKGDSVKRLKMMGFDNSIIEVKADKFVLACGGIENARLLLNSYEKDSGSLKRNKSTGKYFCDHPIAPCASVVGHTSQPEDLSFEVMTAIRRAQSAGAPLQSPFYRLPYEIQKSERVLNAAVQFYEQEPEVSSEMVSLWKLKNYLVGNSARVKSSDVSNVILNPLKVLRGIRDKKIGEKRLAMRFQLEQSPNPASKITLSESKDRFGMRKASLNWTFSSLERRTIDVLIHYVAKQFSSQGEGVIKIDYALTTDRDSVPSDLRGGQHHSGTTRMSDSPDSGVVDANLKVFGVDNLYVVGSSVFPTNGWVNPTHTIVALSCRLAEHFRLS